MLLCYVDHHDRAYDWAERRKIETHPTTGAAQIVEIRETVREVVVPVYTQSPVEKPRLFEDRGDDELLGYGVPPESLDDVKRANEDGLFALAGHLPGEAAEALLELATGGQLRNAAAVRPGAVGESGERPTDLALGLSHPDAQRRFRVMSSVEELERALDAPWDRWTVLLHPGQRDWVERDHVGPARVSGSAGTGKTIVALHRAAHLARANPSARVLLATFSDPLARALETQLRRLVGNELGATERVCRLDNRVSLDALAVRLRRGTSPRAWNANAVGGTRRPMPVLRYDLARYECAADGGRPDQARVSIDCPQPVDSVESAWSAGDEGRAADGTLA